MDFHEGSVEKQFVLTSAHSSRGDSPACRSTHNPDARLSTFTLCLFDLHIAISKNSQSHPKNAHGQLAGVFINGKHLGVLIDFKHALDPTPNASGSLLHVAALGQKISHKSYRFCLQYLQYTNCVHNAK